MVRRQWRFVLSTAFLSLALAGTWAQAAQIKLAWDPPADATGVAGYKLHYGPTSGGYRATVNVGNETSHTLTGLTEGQTYYIAATAYDRSGRESDFSNEVHTATAVAPVASFQVSTASGPAPLAVDFTNTSTGTITDWHWDFGDGGSSTSQAPSHTYNRAGTFTVTLTATGPEGADTETGTITVSPASDETLLEADFNRNTAGFVYVEDAFGTTRQPKYATGNHKDGALQVTLGGVDNNRIAEMSGGWRRTFRVGGSKTASVTLTFRYHLTQTDVYDSGEYSDVLATIDRQYLGSDRNSYVAREQGGGTTGWQTFTKTVSLSPGTHVLTLGGFNNKKTAREEVTTILIDDVVVTQSDASRTPAILSVAGVTAGSTATSRLTTGSRDAGDKATSAMRRRLSASPGTQASAGTRPLARRGDSQAPAYTQHTPSDVMVWLEAEEGMLSSQLESGFDTAASADQYIWMPEVQQTTGDVVQDDSMVQYTFTVPTTGTYVVWGRVSLGASVQGALAVTVGAPATAPGTTEDALEWTIAATEETADPTQEPTWLWHQAASDSLPILFLEAGEYTLTLQQQGGRIKIDRLLITNDLDYQP